MTEAVRDLDIHITMAAETGLVIMQGGEVLAAFSTAAELCQWLEARLRPHDPVQPVDGPMPRVFSGGDQVTPLRTRLFGKKEGP